MLLAFLLPTAIIFETAPCYLNAQQVFERKALAKKQKKIQM